MKKILVLISVIGILFSGYIQEIIIPHRGISATNVIQNPVSTLTLKPTNTATPTNTSPNISQHPAITVRPQTKYDQFVSWLKTDETNKHPYILDNSKIYEEQYVCSQFTRDFIKNATSAGFEVYAVELTGAVRGQNEWHMIAAVVLDKDWYFVDPQTDAILKKEAMFNAYGYEYAYFGEGVSIDRNNAKISMPVSYHTIIGLNGQNFLYLK